jgi:hypothetical protein
VNPVVRQLRQLPTAKLLGVLAGVIVLAGSVTAAAVAALGGSGPIPPAKTLAAAIHDALAGPGIDGGVSAEIQFTDNLVDASSIPNAGPLLTGASGRLWANGSGDLRLELQASTGDTEITVAPGSFQVFDVASNTVYRGTLPTHTPSPPGSAHEPPTLQTITDALTTLMGKVDVSGADPTDVGGAPAYTVSVSPKHDGGLLGSAELAFDAANGVPLSVSVYATGSTSPVLALSATNVSFGPVAASDVTVTPPSAAKVVTVSTPFPKSGSTAGHHAGPARVTGAAAVAAALPFKLDAPAVLAGLPQTSARLLTEGGKTGALLFYGQHLGGIIVIEHAAPTTAAKTPSASASTGGSGLPTISIDGNTGTELATALGTLVRFEANGISYIVLGSVPPAAAEAAARGL